MKEALRQLWASEPVRIRIYSVVLAGLAALVGKGIITADISDVLAAVGIAVFAIPAVESTRRKTEVSPVEPAPVEEEHGQPTRDVELYPELLPEVEEAEVEVEPEAPVEPEDYLLSLPRTSEE